MGPSDSHHAFGSGFGLPRLRPPALNRADGPPRFLGHLLRACRLPRPRQVFRPHVPSPDGDGRRAANRSCRHHGMVFSGLTSDGLLARAPTHRRARCRPLFPSFLLPARRKVSLSVCLAGLTEQGSHLQDDASVFPKVFRILLSYGPAFPGRTGYPTLLRSEDRRPRAVRGARTTGRGHSLASGHPARGRAARCVERSPRS
jgi:hypothetical protein